jgi:hypothetical protein
MTTNISDTLSGLTGIGLEYLVDTLDAEFIRAVFYDGNLVDRSGLIGNNDVTKGI